MHADYLIGDAVLYSEVPTGVHFLRSADWLMAHSSPSLPCKSDMKVRPHAELFESQNTGCVNFP